MYTFILVFLIIQTLVNISGTALGDAPWKRLLNATVAVSLGFASWFIGVNHVFV